MEKRVITIVVLFGFINFLAYFYRDELLPKGQTIRAFGELKADFGTPQGEPMFHSVNISPGESEVKRITIVNEGVNKKLVFFKAIKSGGTTVKKGTQNDFDVEIDDEIGSLYGKGSITGRKTLEDFMSDSVRSEGIFVKIIEPGKSKTFFICVSYPEVFGKALQRSSLIFDMTINAISI